MTRILLLCALLFLFLATYAFAADQQSFKDVPTDHWAADAVKQMRDSGIMKGYSDKSFKGEKPVTRYELAITLQRFVEFVEASRRPLVEEKQEVKPTPKPSYAPPPEKAAVSSLISKGFLPSNTPLAKDGNRAVDTEVLAQCLTSVVARLAVTEADREASKKAESSQKTSP